MNDFYKYLKKDEVCWERYPLNGKLIYMVITKDRFRDRYFLLDVSDGRRQEIAKADNPVKLRSKMTKIGE